MSTQELTNKFVPTNYLQTLLQPTVELDSKPAAPHSFSATDVLPSGSLLSINPPNLGQDQYMQLSENNYLHSNIGNKRDLSYIQQRWVYYQAANRGHVPTLIVRSKKGQKVVKIVDWVTYVLYHCKKIDDLPIGKPSNTNVSTKTAVNNFNHFWNNVVLDPSQQASFYTLRYSFEDDHIGIMCLCSMSHPERALTLAHYANKSTKLKSNDACSGGSKNNYLHSIQRFLKCYEHFYELTTYYDTAKWSWNTSSQYELVRETLSNTTIFIDSKKTAAQREGPNKSAYMTDEEFCKLNAFTYRRAQSFKHTNYPQYLSVMQHWCMQIFLVFACNRGGADELEKILKEEIQPVPGSDCKMTYEPLVGIKNTGVDAHYNLVTKDKQEIVSKEFFDFVIEMKTKSHSAKDFYGGDRLFHIPSASATPQSKLLFQRKVQGYHFARDAVKFYAEKLHEQDASFPLKGFKNGSIRKCHTYILNMAHLPASVQRRSLGHRQGSNYWANTYNNPNDPNIREMVAQTIATKIALPLPTTSPKGTPNRFEPPVTRSATKRSGSDVGTPQKSKRSLQDSLDKPDAVYQSGTVSFQPENQPAFQLPLPSGTQGQIVMPGGITITFSVK